MNNCAIVSQLVFIYVTTIVSAVIQVFCLVAAVVLVGNIVGLTVGQ